MIIRVGEAKISEVKNPREGFGSMINVLYEKLSGYTGTIKMFSVIDLNKGSKVGYHLHDSDMEVYLMLDGKAVVCDNGIEDILNPGDLIITEKGQSHSIENRTDQNITFIAIIIE
jgi:quercetin dioxygenase-like cupin family protein